MLRRIFKQRRYFKTIYRNQKGITGLETAIILIAFVVVAAVFAYTVLSAGLFSTQKSQQAVYSGLQESQSTIEVKGAVVSAGVAQLNSCDNSSSDSSLVSSWAHPTSGATLAASGTTRGTDFVEGTYSLAGTIANTTSITQYDALATHSMTAKAFITGDTITFWAKVDANAEINGLLSFGVSTQSESSEGNFQANLTQHQDITATDGAWHKYTMTVGTSSDTAVYYGIYANTGFTATANRHYWIDDIEITDANLYTISDPMNTFANSVTFTLSLASSGNAMDFTGDTDANGNGIISDESTINHKIVINYNDSTQQVNDLAWTASFIGKHSGSGNMLDVGDKVQITVDLTYINQNASAAANKVIHNHSFTLEVKPPTGAVLTIARTMPDRVQQIDNLN